MLMTMAAVASSLRVFAIRLAHVLGLDVEHDRHAGLEAPTASRASFGKTRRLTTAIPAKPGSPVGCSTPLSDIRDTCSRNCQG
jgi:hypothetical protein